MKYLYDREKNKYRLPTKILSVFLAMIMAFSLETIACYAMGTGMVKAYAADEYLGITASDSYVAGKYEETNTEASFTYRGVTFDFVRSFNNKDNEWFYSVNSKAVYNKNNDCINAVLPDGDSAAFEAVSSKTYEDPHSDNKINVERDASGAVISCSLDLGGTIYNYGTDGSLVSVSDKNGSAIMFARYSDRIVVSDGADRAYTVALNSDKNIASITDPAGGVIGYAYDANGRLAEVTDQSGVVLDTYSYDTYGRIVRNNDISIVYDTDSRITKETYDSGAYNAYTYDGNTVDTVTSTERSSSATYNEYGDVLISTDDEGNTTSYTYDSKRRVVKEENSDGDTVNNTYDENGNLLKSENGEDDYTNYLYDANGNCIREEVFNDSKTSYRYYVYDNKGNVLVSAELKEDYKGDVPSEYDENLTCFDFIKNEYSNGLLASSFDSKENETVSYTYDEYGNEIKSETTSVKDEETTVTTVINTYDKLGNMLFSQKGDEKSAYVYDAAGRTLLANENGKYTRTLYDNLGRVVQEISPEDYDASKDGLPESNSYSDSKAGHTYKYAANRTLTSETNRLGKTTKYIYNDIGSKVREEFDIYKFYYLNHGELYQVKVANATTVSYNYDNKFKLTSESYANDDVIRYAYNEHGDIAAQYHNSNAKPYVTYTYNEDNELIEKVNTDSGLKYVYGENNQVSVYKTTDDSLVQSYVETETEADEETNTAAYTTVEEKHFGTNYTSVIKENDLTFKAGSKSVECVYSTDDEGLTASALIKSSNGTALSLTYSYDDDGNITSKLYSYDNKTLDFVNEYDEDGKIIASGKGSVSLHYTYDDNDQLIGVQGEDYAASYSYDSRGNLTAKNINGEETTYTYASFGWKDLLVAVDDVELTYDANGNVLTYGDKEYTWNSGRQLESITDGANTYSYKYNEDGIRASKTVNGKTTYFNTSGGVISSQYDGSNRLYFQYGNSGEPVGFVYNGTPYLYITNQMNDVIGITNESGTLLAEYFYDEWGRLLSIKASGFNKTLAEINPIRYRGYYYDNESGYYYLQSRYYDPVICRFINADDVEIVSVSKDNLAGINLFAYCNSNPVNNVDYFGEWLARVICALAGAAILGTLAVLICNILKLFVNVSDKTAKIIAIACAALGGVIGAILGVRFLTKYAPNLAKAINKIEKEKFSIKAIGPNASGNIFGIVISKTLIIMLHAPHPNKGENYFHIQVEVKIGKTQKTIYKKAILNVSKNWRWKK